MKNLFPKSVLLLIALSISLSSCEKFDFEHDDDQEEWQTTTVDLTVAYGQTLTYVLPSNMTMETPVISAQATSSGKSELAKEAATGEWTYQYTAKEGFVGTDKVVIDSETETKGHGKKGHGNCGTNQDDDEGYRLVLNINAQASLPDQIKK